MFSGYESPITQIMGQMQTQYEDDCIKVVQQCGFDVNKEELVKALAYDRGQYSKGYEEGYTKAIDDFVDKIKDICKNHSTSSDRYDNEPIYAHKDGTWHSLIDDIVQQLKKGDADNE